MTALLLALAGGVGAAVRFLVDARIGRRACRPGLPLGTAVINISGSFLLGVVVGWSAGHAGGTEVQLVLGTGFLGGYTTFSTASVEGARLALAGEGADLLAHSLGMLLLSIAAAGLGLWIGSL